MLDLHWQAMLRVGESGIQGKGLFTDTPIRERRKLGEMTGERITISEARRRAQSRGRIVIVEISSRTAIDGSVGGNEFQFVNHSCDPNLYVRIANGRIEFYPKKPIRAGEELTCDYGESQHEGRLPCQCGAEKCRKRI